MVCSLGTDSAVGPSILGVHSGGEAFGSVCSGSSMYLSLNSSAEPLSGNRDEIAWKII